MARKPTARHSPRDLRMRKYMRALPGTRVRVRSRLQRGTRCARTDGQKDRPTDPPPTRAHTRATTRPRACGQTCVHEFTHAHAYIHARLTRAHSSPTSKATDSRSAGSSGPSQKKRSDTIDTSIHSGGLVAASTADARREHTWIKI